MIGRDLSVVGAAGMIGFVIGVAIGIGVDMGCLSVEGDTWVG